MALICGWNVLMPHIFQTVETEVVDWQVWQSWSLSVTAPDPALDWWALFWGPKVPWWRRHSSWWWRGGSRGCRPWWKIPWRQPCYSCFSGVAHGFAHRFAFLFDLLGILLKVCVEFLQILAYFLPEMESPVSWPWFFCHASCGEPVRAQRLIIAKLVEVQAVVVDWRQPNCQVNLGSQRSS